MNNRTAAVIITVIAVLCCVCPGLAALCFGSLSFVDYALGSGVFATDQSSYLGLIFGGSCSGIFLIIIAAVIIFLVLRKKKETPPSVPVEPLPPTNPDEPLPPTI
jgi:phosphotransferase system  glucose/maltose/N-acetylglucosamine-specific IIC component